MTKSTVPGPQSRRRAHEAGNCCKVCYFGHDQLSLKGRPQDSESQVSNRVSCFRFPGIYSLSTEKCYTATATSLAVSFPLPLVMLPI